MKYLTELAIKEKVDHFFILGDIFDTWTPIPAERRLFYLMIQDLLNSKISVYILIGNHDYKDHIENGNYSVVDYELLPFSGVRIFSEPQIHTIGNIDIIAMPHLISPILDKMKLGYEDTYIKILNNLYKKSKNGHKIIISHVLLKSIFPASEAREVDKKIFDTFNIPIFLGDVHKPLTFRNDPFMGYVGSPCRISFAEYEDKKRAIIYDTATGKVNEAHIPNRNYLVMKINLQDLKILIEGEGISDSINLQDRTTESLISFFQNSKSIIKDSVLQINILGLYNELLYIDKLSILSTIKKCEPYYLKGVKFEVIDNKIEIKQSYKNFKQKSMQDIFEEWCKINNYPNEFSIKFKEEITKICK